MSTVTFENVCGAHTKRQVVIKMNKFNMFITAVCVLFLIQRHSSQAIKNDFFHELFLLKTKKIRKKAIKFFFCQSFEPVFPVFSLCVSTKLTHYAIGQSPPRRKRRWAVTEKLFFQCFSSSTTT